MSIPGIFPAVARDFVSAPNSTSREDDCFCAKNSEAAALALVTKRANDAVTIFQQGKNGVLHVNLDALVDAVILQRADHFQPGPIADVSEARIFVTAKISLKNAAVRCPIENRAPPF